MFYDHPEDLPASLADWNGVNNEVAAIEHRLKRLGLPSIPPPGWAKRPAWGEDASEDSTKAFAEYLARVLEDLKSSASPEARVVATVNASYVRALLHGITQADSAGAATPKGESVETIAAANPTNLKIQWLAARAQDVPAAAVASAIANIQNAEGDNAAAWGLSLERASASNAQVEALLQRMATSARYEMHLNYGASPLLEAMRRQPPPKRLQTPWMSRGPNLSDDDFAKRTALSIGEMWFTTIGALEDVCGIESAAAGSARNEACKAIGKLLMQKGESDVHVFQGRRILRGLNALDAADADRARHVEWWREVMFRQEHSGNVTAYLDDSIATGDEVEALRRSAERLGKSEPPANWKGADEITL
jgi:hypothetical protein